MTVRDELAEDERVIAGATAGPWTAEEVDMARQYEDWPVWWLETENGSIAEFRAGCLEVEGKQKENAVFSARARTRWPALVAEVRELREIVEAAKAHLEFIESLRRAAQRAGASNAGPLLELDGKPTAYGRLKNALDAYERAAGPSAARGGSV